MYAWSRPLIHDTCPYPNDCPSASKATLMNMDKYFMWIHYERLHNHNKAKHNKTVCIFLGIYCTESTVNKKGTKPSWHRNTFRIIGASGFVGQTVDVNYLIHINYVLGSMRYTALKIQRNSVITRPTLNKHSHCNSPMSLNLELCSVMFNA